MFSTDGSSMNEINDGEERNRKRVNNIEYKRCLLYEGNINSTFSHNKNCY